MKYVRKYLIIFGITMVTAFGVYFWMPNYRGYLLLEDSLIENLSAALFLISFFVGFFLFFKSKVHRKALIIVSAVSLLGFLDEISFGNRTFELNISRLHIKIDAVHDLFHLPYNLIIKLANDYFAYLILLILIGLIILTVLLLKFRTQLTELITRNYQKPPFILTSFFVILIFCSLIIDLGIIKSGVLMMVEELFEMNAALALLFCCLSLSKQAPK